MKNVQTKKKEGLTRKKNRKKYASSTILVKKEYTEEQVTFNVIPIWPYTLKFFFNRFQNALQTRLDESSSAR